MGKGMNPLTVSFQELMNAVTKSITIQIDDEMVGKLKENKYKLCFAKKVGEANYNVVWQTEEDFMAINELSWVPMYQVSVTKVFQDAVKVRVACNPVMVNLGEFVTLDKYGVLSEPVTGSDPTAMTLINNMGKTHPVVNQLCIKPDGTMESKPIYAAEEAMFQGECQLQPKEKVQIWFEQNIETGTMFSKARSKAVEIDLTLKNSATVLYDKNGTWKFV